MHQMLEVPNTTDLLEKFIKILVAHIPAQFINHVKLTDIDINKTNIFHLAQHILYRCSLLCYINFKYYRL